MSGSAPGWAGCDGPPVFSRINPTTKAPRARSSLSIHAPRKPPEPVTKTLRLFQNPLGSPIAVHLVKYRAHGVMKSCSGRAQPWNLPLLVDLLKFLLVLVRIHGFEKAVVPVGIKYSSLLKGRQNLPL